jgi:hypothetical protein
MWNDRKPWRSKKAEDNQGFKTHYKDWCVIKVAVGYRHDVNSWNAVYTFEYRAVAKINAPMMYDENNKLKKQIEVDNLTKHEAHCVAKGLNFLVDKLSNN